jgi:epoxyqueuosine reductase QueG
VLSLGADVCGFAAAKDLAEAPEGFRPTDIFPRCKSVVSFGIALPKGLAEIESTLIYGHFNYKPCPELDTIAYKAARNIEENFGGYAVPLPSDGPYDYWDAQKMQGRGLLSMKHAAVAAGLGTLGKNTLLLNSQYGNMLILGAVLTDLDLTSDPPAEDLCIENCTLCIDSCPVGALKDSSPVNQKACRTNTYGTNARGFDRVNCNQCRTVCPMRYGTE